jgi:hypothetical protein
VTKKKKLPDSAAKATFAAIAAEFKWHIGEEFGRRDQKHVLDSLTVQRATSKLR